ncbi:hypothetical protein PVAP13_1KG499700 [Panicum virgatum]|uniref:Uncharacterized protein n=1 Tax=Panicum virgatum TaxID=38727 RepID=A0A8T0XP16_PANVG|nr:hypothetical protein PVAP13_1KG499700 [Panicum virgatum]
MSPPSFWCQSTGSFFRDRSTTLGTLMGVSLADEEPGQAQDHQPGRDAGDGTETPRAPAHEEEGRRWRRRWRRRRWRSAGAGWWRLCRDDARTPTSLGHFLDMERQLTGAGLLCGDDGAGETDAAAVSPVSETDGRVRVRPAAAEESGGWKLRRPAQGTSSSSLARLPVLLTAICSGGAA